MHPEMQEAVTELATWAKDNYLYAKPVIAEDEFDHAVGVKAKQDYPDLSDADILAGIKSTLMAAGHTQTLPLKGRPFVVLFNPTGVITDDTLLNEAHTATLLTALGSYLPNKRRPTKKNDPLYVTGEEVGSRNAEAFFTVAESRKAGDRHEYRLTDEANVTGEEWFPESDLYRSELPPVTLPR